MKKLFLTALNILSFLSKKKIVYINPQKLTPNRFATKTDYGFWFCGNVFEYSDIAHVFASEGVIEKDDMALVSQIITANPKDSYVFYDIGSNTGPYSLLVATKKEHGTVYSFDPVDAHLSTLSESIRLNNYENRVHPQKIALSNKKGLATFLLSGTGSSLEKDFLSRTTPTIEVSLSDLDSYKEEQKLFAPDFIKIDVEGHEYQVIQGARKTIEEFQPILFVEIAKGLKNNGVKNFTNKNYDTLLELLLNLEYRVYISYKGKLIEAHDFEEDGVFMYLFIPLKMTEQKELSKIINDASR